AAAADPLPSTRWRPALPRELPPATRRREPRAPAFPRLPQARRRTRRRPRPPLLGFAHLPPQSGSLPSPPTPSCEVLRQATSRPEGQAALLRTAGSLRAHFDP